MTFLVTAESKLMPTTAKGRGQQSFNELSKQIKSAQNIDDLDTDAQALFGFLTLLVDIHYRLGNGHTIEYQRGKGYSDATQPYQDLADQVSPVDDALLGS